MGRAAKVQEICGEWINATMVEKNADYGDSHVLTGQTLALWFPFLTHL